MLLQDLAYLGAMNNDMWFFLVLVGIVFLIAATSNSTSKNTTMCSLHKWTSDTNGHYFCTVCKKRPGEIQTDYDKPY
jgi:hypothetical protein